MRPHLSAGIRATEQPRCHTLIQNSFNSVRGNKLDQSSNALLTQINQFFQIHPTAYPPPPRSCPRVQGQRGRASHGEVPVVVQQMAAKFLAGRGPPEQIRETLSATSRGTTERNLDST